MESFISQFSGFPNTQSILSTLLKVWPEHIDYCKARFDGEAADFSLRMEQVATLILKNVETDLAVYCTDYRWMCEEFLAEEIYFRRNGEYRLSTFQAAYDDVYSKAEYMGRYVRGILISQMIWKPHAQAFDFFRTDFLAGFAPGSHYLEVGPGHGFFLYFASQTAALERLEAWDVSKSSIKETRAALAKLGVTRDIEIIEQDILKAPSRHNEFDGAVISEVLEHLERPDVALQSLFAALKPGGRIFINAPINSPAPDHIYLWRSTDEFAQFVEAQGFVIENAQYYPVTGATLEKAAKHDLSVSCVIIASKPAA
jgi:ubiquinone/menaquinone biosynthesis C-methylase UbiE